MKLDPGALAARVDAALKTGVDPGSRTLYLVGEVNDRLSLQVLVGLRVLDEHPAPMKLVLNSVGGVETAGYAIYDALRLARSHVTVEAYGACQSIAALIMQGGDRRLMAPEAQFMIHHGVIGMDTEPQQDAVVSTAERIKADIARYHRILAKRSGLSLPDVRELCLDETYLSARDTVSYGFADAVIRARRSR